MIIKFGRDNKYTWNGYSHAWFCSIEDLYEVGYLRCIEGELFYISSTQERGWLRLPTVYWSPVRTEMDMRAFREHIVNPFSRYKDSDIE